MQKVFLKVVGAVLNLPDKAIGFARFEEIKTGWVVRKKDLTDFEGEDGMVHAIHMALETTHAIAGIRDFDVEMWDVVEIFDNEEDATEAGKRNGQMSIYQIETNRLKWLM